MPGRSEVKWRCAHVILPYDFRWIASLVSIMSTVVVGWTVVYRRVQNYFAIEMITNGPGPISD